MTKGILYLMSTSLNGVVMMGNVKNRESYDKTMIKLEKTGYNNVTGLKREFAIEVDNYESKENMLQRVFRNSRIADSDLYSLSLEEAKQLLMALAGEIVYTEDNVSASKEEAFITVTDILDEIDPIKEDKEIEKKKGLNKFKETHFSSSLTGWDYYFPASNDGLRVYCEETNEEIPNYSTPSKNGSYSKRQILKSAVKDIMGNNTPADIDTMTLYQLAHLLQKIKCSNTQM